MHWHLLVLSFGGYKLQLLLFLLIAMDFVVFSKEQIKNKDSYL